MPNLLQSLRGRGESRAISTIDEYVAAVNSFYYNGLAYPVVDQTYSDSIGRTGEKTPDSFASNVSQVYKRNGVVFACMLARMMAFTEARFQFQQMRGGRPGDLFGTPALTVLEKPWANGSTGELLARMIQDVDLGGNAYVRRTGPTSGQSLERLRPDWVTIVLGTNRDLVSAEVVGYIYEPNGPNSGEDPVPLDLSEVAHWAPIPDPIAHFRGMSWLSPVIREIVADGAATNHKAAFFEHAATPNMVVKFDPNMNQEKALAFAEALEDKHAGATKAYKTMYLGGGADVTVVGSSFEQMDFKAVQGAGETRIAAASGVPPIVVGLSEGLASSTYSNYGQAMRRFGDLTMRPLWRSASGALESIVDMPAGSRLWYDDRHIPFLQEDVTEAAEVLSKHMLTIESGVRAGFRPDSIVKAVTSGDLTLLEHTGLFSVQLQKPDTSSQAGVQPAGTTDGE